MKLCVVLVAVPVNVVPGRAGFLGLPEPDIGELLAVVSAGAHQDISWSTVLLTIRRGTHASPAATTRIAVVREGAHRLLL
jgi:hypothetical protein